MTLTSSFRSPLSWSVVTAAVKPTPDEPLPVVLIYDKYFEISSYIARERGIDMFRAHVWMIAIRHQAYLTAYAATPKTHLRNWDFATEGSPAIRQLTSPRMCVPFCKFFSVPLKYLSFTFTNDPINKEQFRQDLFALSN